MVPLAFDLPQRGWSKLVGMLYSALGVTGLLIVVPPAAHDVTMNIFDEPTARGVDAVENWELGIFSIPMRLGQVGSDGLKRPIRGNYGNCDIYTNLHWSMAATELSPYMENMESLMFGGHGVAASQYNHIWFDDSGGLERLLGDPLGSDQVPQENPRIVPLAGVPDPDSDPYHTQV
ncbi:MAG: hypothetical protein AB1486_13745 [Planctomycetota bacterium]